MCGSWPRLAQHEYAFALRFYQGLLEAGYTVSDALLTRCDRRVWNISSQRGHLIQLVHEPQYELDRRFVLSTVEPNNQEWPEVKSLFYQALLASCEKLMWTHNSAIVLNNLTSA